MPDVNTNVNISELLKPDDVLFTDATAKKEVFSLLIQHLAKKPEIKDAHELEEGIWYRESLMSTGIGLGIGVPHVRLASVENLIMSAAVCKQGITDYESMDKMPVKLVFMIVAGKGQHALYLKALAALSVKFKDISLREQLINAKDAESFCSILAGK